MNDKDYIRVGIELADGWSLLGGLDKKGYEYSAPHQANENWLVEIPQGDKAALAAQLRRQVRTAGYWISILGNGEVKIIEFTPSGAPLEREHTIAEAFADDESMNTIKAVVDSKALEK